jgi:hypothetical protein
VLSSSSCWTRTTRGSQQFCAMHVGESERWERAKIN